MSRFVFSVANEKNDNQLRVIMRNTPMEGEISVIFQREPSYFYAAGTEGKFNQTIIAGDKKSDEIAGMGSRSIKPAFVNGQVVPIGYLSSLRIQQNHRNNSVLSRGYSYLKELHQDNRVKIYLSTIIQDNQEALRILTAGRNGLPKYHDIGLYKTFAIKLINKKENIGNGIMISKGSHRDLDEIVACLHRNGKDKQFYPYYSKDDFISNENYLRDFKVENFYVAKRNEKIIGVTAKWDQSGFKQTVVSGYSKKMKYIRPAYNFISKRLNHPLLPDPGDKLLSFYVSFVAVDGNDSDVFSSLLQALYNDSIGSKYSYMILGLHEKDPLISSVQSYSYVEYKSRAFIVCWEDGEESFKRLDNRVPCLEVATL